MRHIKVSAWILELVLNRFCQQDSSLEFLFKFVLGSLWQRNVQISTGDSNYALRHGRDRTTEGLHEKILKCEGGGGEWPDFDVKSPELHMQRTAGNTVMLLSDSLYARFHFKVIVWYHFTARRQAIM